MTAMKTSRWRVGDGVHKTTDCGDQVTTGYWVTPIIIMVSDCLQREGGTGTGHTFCWSQAALFEDIILYNYFLTQKYFSYDPCMLTKASPTVYCLK